jgi:hypothetical protein
MKQLPVSPPYDIEWILGADGSFAILRKWSFEDFRDFACFHSIYRIVPDHHRIEVSLAHYVEVPRVYLTQPLIYLRQPICAVHPTDRKILLLGAQGLIYIDLDHDGMILLHL